MVGELDDTVENLAGIQVMHAPRHDGGLADVYESMRPVGGRTNWPQSARIGNASDTGPLVFVIDAAVSMRETIGACIHGAGWQVETFRSATDFFARPKPSGASCLILDVILPDGHGLDVQKRVSMDRADMPVIFVTAYRDVPTAVSAMKYGAFDFLTKPCRDDVLLGTIARALDRSAELLARTAEVSGLRTGYASLSRREREVMALVVSGQLNKQVGGTLGISEITVKAHRHNVMRKMHAGSLADLVTMATRLELAPASSHVTDSHRLR